MNSKILAVSVLAVLALAGGMFFVFESSGTGTPTGRSIENEEPVHVFDGEIDNMDVEPGTFEGVGVYDRNCIPIDPTNPHGPVTCDAGIETDEHGVLNFHYEHDMQENPCIAPGEPVEVEILDEDGSAEVSRFVER